MNRPQPPLLAATWAELRRRKVIRALIPYAVGAWVVLQLAEITYEPLGLPPLALTWTVLVVILGFPVVAGLAWFFDMSGTGIARDADILGRRGAGRLFALAVLLLTVVGVGWWLADIYRDTPRDGDAVVAAGAVPTNSIAVLPFDDLSPNGDRGYFADGIAEELLDRLARIEGLNVAARTSSFAFRGASSDVRQIGRTLNVAMVIEGAVRLAEGRVRVTAQLIDARNGFHLWSETYERPDADVFALQDEVTSAIVEELRDRIDGLGEAPVTEGGTDDAQALALYLEAREQWRQRTPASLAVARAGFAQATQRDPEFARAWSGLADALLLQAEYGSLAREDAIAQAEPAAVRAVTLAPRLGEAWASIGLLRLMAGQLEPAQRSLEEAIRLDPRYEMAPMWLANVHKIEGRLDLARAVLQEAHALNPLEPVINFNLAEHRAGAGDFDAAREQLQRVLAVLPDNAMLLRGMAMVEMRAGNYDRAWNAADQALRGDPAAPANLDMMLQVELGLERYRQAETLAAQLPESSDMRTFGEQWLRIRQGSPTWTPVFAERVEAVLDGDGLDEAAKDRHVLALAALARLVGEKEREARQLLERALADYRSDSADMTMIHAMSLLAHLQRSAGQSAAAAAWEKRLAENGERWLAALGAVPDALYLRAMLALHAGSRDEALTRLEEAVEGGFRDRWLLTYDPRLASLRRHPRLIALEARLADELDQQRAAVARAA